MNEGIKNKVVNGIFWSGGANIIQGVTQFLVTLILARFISPADFGIVEICVIFTSISAVFIDSGFTQALIRDKNVTTEDYSSVFVFNTFIGICLYLLLFCCSNKIAVFFNFRESQEIFKVIALTLIFNSLQMVPTAKLLHDLRFEILAKVSFCASVISAILGIVLVYCGVGVWAVVGNVLMFSIVRFFLVWFYSRWMPCPKFGFVTIRKYGSFSFHLLLTSLLDVIVTYLQSFLIGRFYTKSDLGYYGQAKKIETLPSQGITAVIQKVTYPILAKNVDDNEILKNRYAQVIVMTMYIVLPLMCFIFASADNLVLFLLGDNWSDVVIYLRPLCIVAVVMPLQTLNINIFSVKGRTDLLFRVSLVKRGLVVLLLILTLPYGVLLMTWGFVLAFILSAILFIYTSGRLIKYSMKQQINDIYKSIVSSIIAALIVYYTGFFVEEMSVILILGVQFFAMFIVFVIVNNFLNNPAQAEMAVILSQYFKRFRK